MARAHMAELARSQLTTFRDLSADLTYADMLQKYMQAPYSFPIEALSNSALRHLLGRLTYYFCQPGMKHASKVPISSQHLHDLQRVVALASSTDPSIEYSCVLQGILFDSCTAETKNSPCAICDPLEMGDKPLLQRQLAARLCADHKFCDSVSPSMPSDSMVANNYMLTTVVFFCCLARRYMQHGDELLRFAEQPWTLPGFARFRKIEKMPTPLLDAVTRFARVEHAMQKLIFSDNSGPESSTDMLLELANIHSMLVDAIELGDAVIDGDSTTSLLLCVHVFPRSASLQFLTFLFDWALYALTGKSSCLDDATIRGTDINNPFTLMYRGETSLLRWRHERNQDLHVYGSSLLHKATTMVPSAPSTTRVHVSTNALQSSLRAFVAQAEFIMHTLQCGRELAKDFIEAQDMLSKLIDNLHTATESPIMPMWTSAMFGTVVDSLILVARLQRVTDFLEEQFLHRGLYCMEKKRRGKSNRNKKEEVGPETSAAVEQLLSIANWCDRMQTDILNAAGLHAMPNNVVFNRLVYGVQV